VVCSRVRELQEALSAAAIALEIPGRNARLRPSKSAGISSVPPSIWILDERGADMVDVPGGASGLLARDYKGKEGDRLVARIDSGVVSPVNERGHEPQAAEEPEQWRTHHEERRD
jgi:hypothetical protein